MITGKTSLVVTKTLLAQSRSLQNVARLTKSASSMSRPIGIDCFEQPELVSTLKQLDKIAPRFSIAPSRIKVLNTPVEFYDLLKVGVVTRPISLLSF